jgi:hypothetical protein
MDYQLSIKQENIQPHIDIENEIAKRKNGQMTLTLRIDKGNISDISVVEYIDVREYLRLKSITFEELTIAHDLNIGNKPDAVRPDNGKL